MDLFDFCQADGKEDNGPKVSMGWACLGAGKINIGNAMRCNAQKILRPVHWQDIGELRQKAAEVLQQAAESGALQSALHQALQGNKAVFALHLSGAVLMGHLCAFLVL